MGMSDPQRDAMRNAVLRFMKKALESFADDPQSRKHEPVFQELCVELDKLVLLWHGEGFGEGYRDSFTISMAEALAETSAEMHAAEQRRARVAELEAKQYDDYK